MGRDLNEFCELPQSYSYQQHRPMKFIIQNNDRTGRQVRSSMSEGLDSDRLYYNVVNPSNKIQCDDCKRDVSKATKILNSNGDYCPSCFANQSEYTSEYHVINKLDFPLFDHEWTADEELLLFEGLQKHGFGNWTDIADFIGSNKTREEVEEHYQQVYLGASNYIPTAPILSKRDNNRKITIIAKEGAGRRQGRISARPATLVSAQPARDRVALTVQHTALTVHHTAKNGSPAEIVGYMPKRGDFEVEYDNDAELLLAQMEFTDEDTQEEKAMKFRLIDIYNQKLNERIRRKQFVINRGLLDLKEQVRLDRTRTKEEKQMYNMLKVFARFNTADDHEKLVQAVIKERQIRQKIEELKEFKKKGFKTLSEIQEELEGKKKKDDKMRKKDLDIFGLDKSKTRRNRKDPANDKNEVKSIMLTREEQELCRRLSIPFANFTIIKEAIVRESVRQGSVSKPYVYKMFKLDPGTIEPIFDFLVEQQEIVEQEPDA